MDTLRPRSTSRHSMIQLETRHPTQFIDLTDDVETLVSKTGIRIGLVNLQTLHTTTAIVVNEREPLLLADFATLLERLPHATPRIGTTM